MSTHASPSQQLDKQHVKRRIVVGVDTRGRSASALVWAAAEADRGEAALILVTARRDEATSEPAGDHDLGALAGRLTSGEVEMREAEGDAVEALLRAASEADLLVVGCRSMRPTQRMVVGSTSRAVACWSPVPVVVVPEAWMQPTMASSPVVAGVRPPGTDGGNGDENDAEVLGFAFDRASALAVPLVVVSAWEIPDALAWSPQDIERERSHYDDALSRRLAPWRARYPRLEVVARNVAENPDHALLDASHVAQMVVVGRHHSAALSGLLGHTARHVLRNSTRPVAVVPAGSREQLVHDLAVQRALADVPWGPTF
jgi:nucleotide-binding universal stress UspA family protein